MNEAKIVAGCSTATEMLSILDCKKAVLSILQEANFRPNSSSNLILPRLWVEFSHSALLKEGVRRIALSMINRVQNSVPTGQLFEDFRAGFVNSGFDSAQSEEAAWKLMALVASGGANTGARLLAYDLPPPGTRHLSLVFR